MSVLNGILDFIASVANQAAKNVDRMDDDQLKKRSSKYTASEMREAATATHEFYESRQNRRDDSST